MVQEAPEASPQASQVAKAVKEKEQIMVIKVDIKADVQEGGAVTGKFSLFTARRGYVIAESDVSAIDFESFMQHIEDVIEDALLK